MNNSFGAKKIEPETTCENNINEIKDNHLKSIPSAATNPLAITYFEESFDPICINNSFKAAKFEPEQTI